MFGWMISIVMLISGCTNNNTVLVVTSGLFAIAGAIANAGSILSSAIKKKLNTGS